MAALSTTYLLEAAWEVCNKVGGIHTVITSKLAYAQEEFRDRYITIGPWLGDFQRAVFQEETIPSELQTVFNQLEAEGITCHFGTWLLPEEPKAILIAWDGLLSTLNTLKSEYWQTYTLDTLNTNFYDVDQPLLWATAVGKFAHAFADLQEATILHAHEWMTGGSLLVGNHPKLRTVFTTHATVLGRALSSQNIFIYDKLDTLNPEVEARHLQVLAKHQIERLSAERATAFTTVSDITAREATAFLGRTPTMITENGLNTDILPDYDTLAEQRREMRKVLHDFVASYFFPAYRFDLEQTTFQFTMGRNEVHNKGYDLYLQSLADLDTHLRAEQSEKTVIAFFLVPADVLRLRPEVGFQLTAYRQMQQLLRKYSASQPLTLFSKYLDDQITAELPAPLVEQLAAIRTHLPTVTNPPLSPYDLRGQDAILDLATQYGLHNSAENRVKVVYMPLYLDGFDGIFNLSLYSIISGFDLAVFPSLYEPWGYTPMEGLMLGIPTITSSLAGYGKSLHDDKQEQLGVTVLDRSHNKPEEERGVLSEKLLKAVKQSPHTLSLARVHAYETALDYGWDTLYARYLETYKEAEK